ncbi:MAG: O-antigen ligase family protein [Candidatus Moranbacteria bacterium]|nr:O-antigen ligase family protein [Candidatus Moranbacteria bacterium]
MFGKNQNRIFLLGANVSLVLFLIILSNLEILPMGMGDFVFFAILTLALALYRPGWVFLFFASTIMLENINLAPIELGIAIRPYQFFGGMTILAMLIRLLAKRLDFKLARLVWPDYLVIVLALAGFLSAIGSPARGVSLKQSIVLASFAALYFLTRNFLQTSGDIKKTIPFFLSSSATMVGYGIWQNARFAHNLPSFEVMPGRSNATFAEADWLGIYLSLLLAVIYSLIFYLSRKKEASLAGDVQISNFKFQIFQTTLYSMLIATYALLILTVSRSAWLGALGVTFIFLFVVFTRLKFRPGDWRWKDVIGFKIRIIGALAISVAAVYFFNLTDFQLGNRLQSTGTGLQKITISCQNEELSPNEGDLVPVEELENIGCRHIDLEEIANEKARGNFVTEVYRDDPNVSIRSAIYGKSWGLIKAHPFWGIGWGSISVYLGQDERGAGLNASNIFLEVWLGSGLIGLVAFILLWMVVLARALVDFLQDDPEMENVGIFLLLGFFAILIPNLFNSGIMLGYLWLFLGASFIDNKVKK